VCRAGGQIGLTGREQGEASEPPYCCCTWSPARRPTPRPSSIHTAHGTLRFWSRDGGVHVPRIRTRPDAIRWGPARSATRRVPGPRSRWPRQIFREILLLIARLRGPPRQRDRQMGSMRQTPPIKEPRAAKSRGQGGRGSVDGDRCSPPCRIYHKFRLPCNFSSP